MLGCIGKNRGDVIEYIKSLLVDQKDDLVNCFSMVALIRLKQYDESFLPSLLKYQNHNEELIRSII